MDEWETIEIEYDTGCYDLYCLLGDCYCAYGELEQGCPLAFRYRLKEG